MVMLALSLIISAQNVEKKCKSCGKPISQCQYKGRHPVPQRNLQVQQNTSQNQQLARQGKRNQQSSKKKEKIEDYKITDFSELCPDENHPHAIDLGLPSGLLWACCNVGAVNPNEKGNYFAWGEVKQKSVYDWVTYKLCNGSAESCHSIGPNNDISKSMATDVAFLKWGTRWSIPKKHMYQELKENCKFQWATFLGVRGALITGSNGNRLFMPGGGHRINNGRWGEDMGEYWTSELSTSLSYDAMSFYFVGFQNSFGFSGMGRCCGLFVRPIANYSDIIDTLINNMVFVEGGSFMMGSNNGDSYRGEKPMHNEDITSFYIGKYEVTQDEWEVVMGVNPSEFKGVKHPVENVSWDDCQVFIQKLNDLTGMKFRLPTEAEWEYAARGGKLSKGYRFSGSNSLDSIAVYDEISRKKGKESPDYGTHNVGSLKPNELGLYDMSGNVDEWCQNSHTATMVSGKKVEERAHRGGNWFCFSTKSTENMFDLWKRGFYPQGNKYNATGLRLVR